ncbi:Phosphatidylinositol N-acetylglucosaminyltransferase subunit Q [Sesamum alatum]|uniref:Phosphatidylinositol N-acetylglucosaminyltransferase subunit Q n=1 Tax=Sesamum alatum TaxID=300844 RepID=A0AAE2CRR8_9LAMI|nr:Phosphatidylinositol N-acetylglucosaminyltransferase subunit Q [Sesamum alatum]
MGRRRKCRLWWPSNLFSQTPPNSSVLFGWFIPSSEASLDIVIAFACDERTLTSSITSRSDLQEILQGTNKKMPAFLQDKRNLSLLGYLEADFSGNTQLVRLGNDKNKYTNLTSDQSPKRFTSNRGNWNWSCGCSKHDGILEEDGIVALENMWIKLVCGLSKTMDGRVLLIPKLDHLHLNSEITSDLDLHVLFYEIPTFGGHHYSLGTDSLSNTAASPCKKPKWFDDLHQRDPCLDLDTVIQAMNSANAAQILFHGHRHAESSSQFLFFRMDWSCVEFAEKAAFHKHSIWSNVLVDVLLGNIFGIALWFMAEPASLWISNFAHDFTNNWLRNGCVWLMGNPAGFKLNTELAGVLGMISLNAIQIWSTLWVLMGSLSVHFTKALALCGMIFGLTSAAALVVDIISLLTMHVLTLHLFLSLLYSTQTQAVAALWRLFRGRKWNPLRHRLDSYDYTVEQHVVGSLLFTPILLLLPTTSAFYIFFTILHTSVRFICIVVEAAISFIHSTPYAKVLLWLKRRNRFPSGIWFDVTLCQHSETGAVNGSNSLPGKLQETAYASSSSRSTILVSFLHSNYLNLGEVVRPHYRYCYSAFSRSSIGSSAYGLLTGKSIPYAPGPSFPLKLPWIVIPWKEYWRLCRDSVYACREDPYNHLRE